MTNKKAFTLIEVLISITIFSIIAFFLNHALDITQKSNKFYHDKLLIQEDTNYLKKMLFLDITNRLSNVTLDKDSDENMILTLETSHIYHNPFFTNITYLLTKEKNLVRIESKKKFNKKNLDDKFFDNAYVDVIDTNVTRFIGTNKKNQKLAIYIDNILWSINL